jgi:hypothetical protein
MTIIWTAAVDHKHGTTLFGATTEAGIYAQLADYCRQWWVKEMPADAPDPLGMTDREVVSFYFDTMSDSGDEWHVVEEVRLATGAPPPP